MTTLPTSPAFARWRSRVALGLAAVIACGSPGFSQAAEAGDTFRWSNEHLSNFGTMFDKACTEPAKYRSIKADFASTARSADAKANQLLHPQRTIYHVVGTDLAAYETYYPNACERQTRMSQCLPGKLLSAEEACDCAAGYMGEVQTGVGAGELITSSNHAIGARSCRIAADRAVGTLQARYLAQLGRAQLYDRAGTREGVATLKQAIAAGYRRGEVDLARASLRDVEFGGLSLDNLGVAMKHLAVGKAAGARDTGSVIDAINQVAQAKKWNADVFSTWTRLTESTGNPGSADMDAETEAARRAAERQGRRQESRPLPAPTPPIGGSNGLYGCASPPCM